MYRLLMLLICLSTAGCCCKPVPPPEDPCAERAYVAATLIKGYENLSNKPTLDRLDVYHLIRPFIEVNEDPLLRVYPECGKYDEQRKSSAFAVLRKRKDEVTDHLKGLCSEIPKPMDRDVSKQSGLKDQRKAAKKVLDALKLPTDVCLQ
jgi:hypothetical protein